MLIEIIISTCIYSNARINTLTLLQETCEHERHEMTKVHPTTRTSSGVQIERFASLVFVY
jgi:hypothetical protein